MFKGLYLKIKKVNISNFLFDRFIRLLYVILSLYLGANFLEKHDFFILQQITLFQSFLIFALALPVNSILVRLGSSSIDYFKSLLISISILRFFLGIATVIFFVGYLYYADFSSRDLSFIVFGIIPTIISTIFVIDILPHVFNFDGRKNWELILLFIIFFIIKCLLIIIFKCLLLKIVIELIEIMIVVIWNYRTYVKLSFRIELIAISNLRVKRLIKSSLGLFLNGILSVFILRIDQFALIRYVDKETLSSYMLIVSITSLFVTPMGLLSERVAFLMSMAKSKSLADFSKVSNNFLLLFAFLSTILYLVFVYLFNFISLFVFKRDLSGLNLVAIILGTSVISNSVGMIFGQINSTLNGGIFTMKRSFVGCLVLFSGVTLGFKMYGITGVAIASATSLFLTNILFWFLSPKVKRIIFYKHI